MHGIAEGAGAAPRRRADRAGRPLRRGRPQGRRLLGRHAPAARPRAGAGPRARDPVPRRADHRPRRAEPHRALGRGPAARLRRTASPSSSPPSTWRRPTRSPTASGSSTPARSSPRAPRTRSRPRSAGPPSRPRPQNEAELERMRDVLARFGVAAARRPRRASPCASTRAAPSSPTSSARSTPRGSRSQDLEIHAPTPRRRLPRQDRPPARGRRRTRPSTPRRARASWRRCAA